MVDSSVWIEYFRRGEGEIFDAVDGLLDEDRALLCGMVELEIVQGLRPREREVVTGLFGALPYLETERQDYVAAGERLGELRGRGITIPGSDCLIGVLCARHDLSLLTLDSHFEHLSDVERFPSDASTRGEDR